MGHFFINGYLWKVAFVDPDDPMLVDRTGTRTVATTDPTTNFVYLSNDLVGDFLIRVLIHEIGHCALFSFDLLGDIHRMVKPEYWIEAEEWICNFIADYGMDVFRSVSTVLGYDAIAYVPRGVEMLIA